MTDETNWALVIGGGIVTGLLILAIITGLYLLLSRPPAAEPTEPPEGMLAYSYEGILTIDYESRDITCLIIEQNERFDARPATRTNTPSPAIVNGWWNERCGERS